MKMWHSVDVAEQPAELYPGDIKSVLLSSEAIQGKVAELGAQLGTWGLLPMRISEMDPTIQRGRSIL